MKIQLPVGNCRIEVNLSGFTLVHALYKPNIYIVRTVSPYPQNCNYCLWIRKADKLPYLLEDNIGLSEMRFTDRKQKADGYFVVCSEKYADYLLKKEEPKKECYYNWGIPVGTGLMVLAMSGIFIFL